MLGNALGVLVALFGLFAVGAFGSAIVWTMFAWIGRRHDWLLSFVTPLGLASAAAPPLSRSAALPGAMGNRRTEQW